MKDRIRREVALLVGLLFVGIVLLPIAIYLVGTEIFGDYSGGGYGVFFGTLSAKIRGGDTVTWFLVLSPFLAVSTLRLMAWGWRKTAQGSRHAGAGN